MFSLTKQQILRQRFTALAPVQGLQQGSSLLKQTGIANCAA